jgi:hypothetical protein
MKPLSGLPNGSLAVSVPLETAVIRKNRDLITRVHHTTTEGIVVDMDVRKGNWQRMLGLPKDKNVYWADIRQIYIRELSVMPWPITYRLTYGDGWYRGIGSKKVYFGIQKHLEEIDLERECSKTTIRAAVLLCVLGGIGFQCVSWMMKLLFHCEISKSALDRWVRTSSTALPDQRGMAQALNADKKITECHIDEIFGVGRRPKACTVVLKDEHGRIFAAREVEEKTRDKVVEFLREVKEWGLQIAHFYMDGCEEYRDAARIVFPEATIQYDYFHIIQNIWKKLWKELVGRRRRIKERGEDEQRKQVPGWRTWLSLAQRMWENRYIILKGEAKLSEEEKEKLEKLMEEEVVVERIRRFAKAVWSIFQESKTEEEAKEKLAELRNWPEVIKGSVYMKSVQFLESRFEDMVTYLRQPGVRRNSYSESGMRCLRRMEQGHDGFRGAEGLDRYLRLYQAMKYLNWTVHGGSRGLHPPSV